MQIVQIVKLTAILVFFPTYAVLGGLFMRRWRVRRPQPAIETDAAAWTAYWLPKLIVFEAWGLAGGAAVYALLAFVAPTLHGADERYFILGGGMAFPFLALILAGIDVYVILNARRLARRQSFAADSSSPARS